VKYEFHHPGIPTNEVRVGERYPEQFGVGVAFIVADGAPVEFLEIAPESAAGGDADAGR